METHDKQQADNKARCEETNRTRRVLIYRVTCTQGFRMDEQGTGHSLEPWGRNTPYYEGYDDGGRLYELPDGFKMRQTTDYGVALFDAAGRYIPVSSDKGKPVLISWPIRTEA
jgi:hypothetical protein